MKNRNVTLKCHDGAEVGRAAPKPTELSAYYKGGGDGGRFGMFYLSKETCSSGT